MGFFSSIGGVLKKFEQKVTRPIGSTVKKAVRDTVDEAARHKTALAVGATLLGAPAAAVAIGGAVAGAAKRGGGLRDAITGGAQAGATSAATSLVRSAASSILTRRAPAGAGGFRGTILSKAKEVAAEKVTDVLTPAPAAGMPVLVYEPDGSFAGAMDRTEREIQRRGMERYGRSWQDTQAQRDAIAAEMRNGGMLNVNRDRPMEASGAGTTPVDLPAVSVVADAPTTEMAATTLPAWKKWLPLAIIAVLVIVLLMSKGKKG